MYSTVNEIILMNNITYLCLVLLNLFYFSIDCICNVHIGMLCVNFRAYRATLKNRVI